MGITFETNQSLFLERYFIDFKADMRARGIESPDRADALIGAAAMQTGRSNWAPIIAMLDEWRRRYPQNQPLFPRTFIQF